MSTSTCENVVETNSQRVADVSDIYHVFNMTWEKVQEIFILISWEFSSFIWQCCTILLHTMQHSFSYHHSWTDHITVIAYLCIRTLFYLQNLLHVSVLFHPLAGASIQTWQVFVIIMPCISSGCVPDHNHHPSYMSFMSGFQGVTLVASPLGCFCNIMESCFTSAHLRWIYDLIEDILACQGSINLHRDRWETGTNNGVSSAESWHPGAPLLPPMACQPDDGWLTCSANQRSQNNLN